MQKLRQLVVSFFVPSYNRGMDEKLALFQEIFHLFQEKGHTLLLVGGTVRDFLLSRPLDDMDLVTDATPNEMKDILKEQKINDSFAKFGFIRLIYKGVSFDITTLRKEKGYGDFRHPNKIVFVKKLKQDYKRRDFTINAMYMDEKLHVIDYAGGLRDVNDSLICMVGNPNRRIKEDPLRIIRAIRFSLDLGFHIERRLDKAMRRYVGTLSLLNPDKIKQDIRKIKFPDKQKIRDKFDEYGIHQLTNMIE